MTREGFSVPAPSGSVLRLAFRACVLALALVAFSANMLLAQPTLGPNLTTNAAVVQAVTTGFSGLGTISNVSFQGNPRAVGTFSNGSADVGIASGLILSTGLASSAATPVTTTLPVNAFNPTANPPGSSLGIGAGAQLPLIQQIGVYGGDAGFATDVGVISFNLVATAPVSLKIVFGTNETAESPGYRFPRSLSSADPSRWSQRECSDAG